MTNYTLGNLEFKLDEQLLSLQRIGDYICRDEPGLADGLFLAVFDYRRVEGNQLRCVRVEQKDQQLDFFLEDAAATIAIHSVWKYDPETNIISRQDFLTNIAPEKAIMMRRFLTRFPLASGDYEVYTQQSRWGLENQGQWNQYNAGMLRLTTRRGRSSEGGTPFAAVRANYHTHAVAFHVIPTGNWMMRFYKEVFSHLKPYMIVEIGQCDEDLYYRLEPQKTLATPQVLLHVLPGREIESGTAYLHRYAMKYLTPPAKTFPVVYNTWLDKMHQLDVPRLRRQLRAVKEMGVETFVIDSGWFRLQGDWREKEDTAFYGKMKSFADEVRDAGLNFGIWMEPEFVNPKAPIIQEHPEWFDRTMPNGDYRIRIATKAGQDYLFDIVSQAIEKYGLRYLKLDMNRSCGYDDTGAELSEYAAGWRQAMTRLHETYPEVIFENCSSGAMRTDLNTLGFFDTHFISDNANLWEVIRISQGMLLRFPPGRLFRWLVASGMGDFRPFSRTDDELIVAPQAGIWLNFEKVDLDFAIIASMLGVLGISGNPADMTPATRQRFARHIAWYKQHREAIYRSEAWLLTAPEAITLHEGWMIFQLNDPVSGEVNIFAFHKNSDGNPVCRVHLHDLPSQAQYRRTDGTVIEAQLLQERGLDICFEYDQHGEYKGQLITLTRLN